MIAEPLHINSGKSFVEVAVNFRLYDLDKPSHKWQRLPSKAAFAVRMGLEPTTSAVTGQHSNQLNYRTIHLHDDQKGGKDNMDGLSRKTISSRRFKVSP